MILNGVVTPGQQPGLPWLVWLHGFLGSAGEWQDLVPGFRPWPQLCIDLPGHGGSADCAVADFAAVDGVLRETLEYYGIRRYWLIGYSLGGRIAMYHASQEEHPGLCGLVVEGGNPGLSLPEERLARQASDDNWARRFREQPLPQVLDDWYRQPVFATLTEAQRRALVALRSNNNPRTLAAMLSATSLGRQPDLSAALAQLTLPFYYLCGERDSKFRAIGEGLSATTLILSQAGHNGHRENPAAFAQCLHDLLCHPTQGPTHDLS